jgi:tRNA(Ile)-lysidine synthase
MYADLEKVIVENRLLSPGSRVLVAVSGGADSMVLLHLLHGISASIPCSLFAAHLDHGIRPESRGDAVFVRQVCDSLEVPLTVERIDVPAIARRDGIGLEEAGRQQRRLFLERTAAGLDCQAIALGHHRGDQAETFLIRLLRGAALPGLAAMRLRNGRYIRPLLPFSRQEILRFLAEENIPWVEDDSNTDPAYTRNRIRHDVVPLLTGFNPRIEEHLARLSDRISLEEDYWRGEERRLLALVSSAEAEGLLLNRPALLALHPALRIRVLRRALEQVRGDLRGIYSVHLDSIHNLLQSDRPQGEIHLQGGWAGRRYDRLYLLRTAPVTAPPYAIDIPGPGVFHLPDGGRLHVSLASSRQGESCRAVEFDGAGVKFPLLVRSFRPGDRFRPSGMNGTRKLKAFFIDEKIDRERRHQLPLIIAAGGTILWVAGCRRCEGFAPQGDEGPFLRLFLEDD